ncbi:MAG: PKD domain-containing protein [Chitinophagaceae bacterium]
MKLPLRKPVVIAMLCIIMFSLQNQLNAQSALPVSINIGKDTLLPLKQSSPTSITLTAKIVGNPVAIKWTKVTGANNISIASPTVATTTITGLTAGFYSFRCDILDVLGVSILSDLINITVVDYQQKNRVPCRTGAPKVWVLSATNTTDLMKPYLRRDGMDIQGGDTIKINRNPNNGGKYRYLYLGDFGGDAGCPVVVVPNGQVVEIGGAGHRWHIGKNVNNTSDSNVVNHAVIDGTYLQNKGIRYGFQSTGTAWGLSTSMVTDLEIKGCLFENNSLGMQMKVYSDSSYAWTVYDNFIMKNISIHDNYFHNITGTEGMYIGHTSQSGTSQAGNDGPTLRMDSVFIYNNFIDSTGWDPMQTSSARYVEMHDNVIMNSATVAASSQDWGLLLGGNCTGKIFNNLLYKGTSAAIGVLGYGQTDIYHNFVGETTATGIYVNGITTNILEAGTPGMLPPMKLNVRDNILAAFGNRAIFHANNDKRALPGVIRDNYVIEPSKTLAQTIVTNAGDAITGNQLRTSFPVEVRNIGAPQTGFRIEVKQGAAIDTFTTSKEALDWLFSRLNPTATPNIAPVAKAGADQVITLPVKSVTVSASGSTDNDGQIASYSWFKVDGPASYTIASPGAIQTTIGDLEAGTYRFRILVTDDDGATGSDTLSILVKAAVPPANIPPTAHAGNDKYITLPVSASELDGSASTDPDGEIISYSWSKVEGPAGFRIGQPAAKQTTVTDLTTGIYLFRLEVRDNGNLIDADTVKVTVQSPPAVPNKSPVANAGKDGQITIPVNSFALSGIASSDADGEIVAYQWSKIEGPGSYRFTTPAQVSTNVENLVAGTYRFRLLVTDNNGASSADTISVLVNNAAEPANNRPTAAAGADKTVTLPINMVLLSGSGSTDSDGTITRYGWRNVSGPAGFSITSPSSVQTVVSGLAEGIYEFELRVEDNDAANDVDTIRVTVHAVPAVPNIPPVADAGDDQVILLPTSMAELKGSATDADGRIVRSEWTIVGTKEYIDLMGASSLNASLIGLQEGTYLLELKVWDNLGASVADTVEIKVRGAKASTTSLFPNPTTGNVTLQIDANTMMSATSIVIYDLALRIVHEEKFLRDQPSVTRNLDVSSLPAGLYIVVTTVDLNHRYTSRLVKH